ncbi:MAG: hypothetical protein FWH03_04740 [Firmicutes bacterium]|nr:hypothetical protein [Bacillota bacterium]
MFDETKAQQEFETFTQTFDEASQYFISKCYEYGVGCPQNHKLSIRAFSNLDDIYGINQKKIEKWYKQAKQQNLEWLKAEKHRGDRHRGTE